MSAGGYSIAARLLVGAGEPLPTVVDSGHRRRLDLSLELPDGELEAAIAGDQFDEILDRIAAHVGAIEPRWSSSTPESCPSGWPISSVSAWGRTRWPPTTDVVDHWESCVRELGDPFAGGGRERVRLVDTNRFGYLSTKDAALIRDAVLLECDTLLTLDRKLARNADHMSRALGLEVLRPPELYEVLRPHLRGL